MNKIQNVGSFYRMKNLVSYKKEKDIFIELKCQKIAMHGYFLNLDLNKLENF